MAEAKKIPQYLCIFGFSEVKKAVEVIEAIEVIMAEGANEATEHCVGQGTERGRRKF